MTEHPPYYTYRIQIEDDIIRAASEHWPRPLHRTELEFIQALAATITAPAILPAIHAIQPLHTTLIGHAIRAKLMPRHEDNEPPDATADPALPPKH